MDTVSRRQRETASPCGMREKPTGEKLAMTALSAVFLVLLITLRRRDAIVQTTAEVTVSILTSGSTLAVVGFLLGFLSSHGILAQLGMFLGIGSLLSIGIVLLTLPGLLYTFDSFIQRLTKSAPQQKC